MTLVIEALDEATFERAAALIAREHAAARQVRPELPAGFGDAAVCEAALRHLCGRGHHGLVVTSGGRELTSPVPRLCPDGQPYIGPTATVPAARGRGVGHALVDAALTWAHDHRYQWVSVDFETANPLSRPFWLNAGFRPTGYGLFRVIEPR